MYFRTYPFNLFFQQLWWNTKMGIQQKKCNTVFHIYFKASGSVLLTSFTFQSTAIANCLPSCQKTIKADLFKPTLCFKPHWQTYKYNVRILSNKDPWGQINLFWWLTSAHNAALTGTQRFLLHTLISGGLSIKDLSWVGIFTYPIIHNKRGLVERRTNIWWWKWFLEFSDESGKCQISKQNEVWLYTTQIRGICKYASFHFENNKGCFLLTNQTEKTTRL